jgi:hypothetical protein
VTFEPELPWDSPKFREKKNSSWTAGCRWLQSWWREQQRIQPGERTEISETLVGAMFPVDTDAEKNFFSPRVITSLEDRVIYGAEHGVVKTEVLFRSLLETQVLVFNLVGEFVAEPNALLPWVQSIDRGAAKVTEIRIEWQPERRTNLGGGPGFDVFVEYRARLRGARRFLALECRYAENLAASKMTMNPRWVDATEESQHWRTGASRRLDRPSLRPYWISTLIAQTVAVNDDYDAGRVVAMACAADADALLASNFVRAELLDPDAWFVRSSYDSLVDALAPTHPEWAAYIRTRYLDFSPVVHLLDKTDPRRAGPRPTAVASDDLLRLVAVGEKVAGKAAFKRVRKLLDTGTTDPSQVAALETRAADLAADLEAFWEALAGLDG